MPVPSMMPGLQSTWLMMAMYPVDNATQAVAMQATAEAAAAEAALMAVMVDVAALAAAVEMMMGMEAHMGALVKVELMSGRSDDVFGAQGREWHVKKACSSVSRPSSYRASSSDDCDGTTSAHSTQRHGWYRGVQLSEAFSGALAVVARWSLVAPMQLSCCRGLKPTRRLAVNSSRFRSSQVKSRRLADKVHYHDATRPMRRRRSRRRNRRLRRNRPRCSMQRTAQPPSLRRSPSWQRRLEVPSPTSKPNSRHV